MDPPPVPHLPLARPHPLGLVDLLHVRPGLDAAEEDHRLLGLVVALDLVGDDQGDLGDVINAVACEKRWNTFSQYS